MKTRRFAAIATLVAVALIYSGALVGCAAAGGPSVGKAAGETASGKYEQAAQTYLAVIANSKDPDALRQARLGLAALYMEHLNEPTRGIALYQSVLREGGQHPDLADAHWHVGVSEYGYKRFDDARQHFLTLILDHTDFGREADGWLYLAASYEMMRKLPDAVDSYWEFMDRYREDVRIPYAQFRRNALLNGLEIDPPSPDKVPETLVSREQSPSGTSDNVLARVPGQGVRVNANTMNDARVADGAAARVSFGPLSRPGAWQTLRTFPKSDIFGFSATDMMYETGDLFGGEDLIESLDGNGANLDDAVRQLGMIYYQIGEYGKAGACLEAVVNMGAEEIEMLITLTVCYLKFDAVPQAKETLNRAYKDSDTAVSRMINWAEFHPDETTAKKGLEIALGIDPAQDAKIKRVIATLE
ncbi:MAG: tetratricopeptide repeat protein [Candidatus Poribacteria bacterium]|nr:tetratricopeptide repeat protein [Candidatus Poribacteria bacterium]